MWSMSRLYNKDTNQVHSQAEGSQSRHTVKYDESHGTQNQE
jgi:hypothetical protein